MCSLPAPFLSADEGRHKVGLADLNHHGKAGRRFVMPLGRGKLFGFG